MEVRDLDHDTCYFLSQSWNIRHATERVKEIIVVMLIAESMMVTYLVASRRSSSLGGNADRVKIHHDD